MCYFSAILQRIATLRQFSQSGSASRICYPFQMELKAQLGDTEAVSKLPVHKLVSPCRIVPSGSASCNYTVDYALVYITSTNSFLKKAIERGRPASTLGQIGLPFADCHKEKCTHSINYSFLSFQKVKQPLHWDTGVGNFLLLLILKTSATNMRE